MDIHFSPALLDDAYEAVSSAYSTRSEINVPLIADTLQARNVADNVAIEDIQLLVVRIAGEIQAPIVFQKRRGLAQN